MVSVVFLWTAARRVWANLRKRHDARRVQGRVARHVLVAPSDGDGPAMHALEVEYTYEGRRHLIRTTWATSRPPALGRSMGVLVPRGRPAEATIDSVFEWWTTPALFAMLGLAAAAAGAVLISSGR